MPGRRLSLTRAVPFISPGKSWGTSPQSLETDGFPRHLARPLPNVHGQADGAPAVLQSALHRLADPQRGVGGEAVAPAPVELLDGSDQAEHALLDEIRERQALALVAAGVGNDQPQVGIDHALLRLEVAALEALGELDLLVGGEQWPPPRLGEQLRDRVLTDLGRAVHGRAGMQLGALGSQLPALVGVLVIEDRSGVFNGVQGAFFPDRNPTFAIGIVRPFSCYVNYRRRPPTLQTGRSP